MAVAFQTEFTLSVNDVERQELLTLLEQTLQNSREERRRTDNPDYRSAIANEQSILQSLADKVRRLKS